MSRLTGVLRHIIGGVEAVSADKELIQRDKEWAGLAKHLTLTPKNSFSWEVFAGAAARLSGNKAVKDAKLVHAKLLEQLSGVFGETVTGDALLTCAEWVFDLLKANLHAPGAAPVRRELQSRLGTLSDAQFSTLVALTGSCLARPRALPPPLPPPPPNTSRVPRQSAARRWGRKLGLDWDRHTCTIPVKALVAGAGYGYGRSRRPNAIAQCWRPVSARNAVVVQPRVWRRRGRRCCRARRPCCSSCTAFSGVPCPTKRHSSANRGKRTGCRCKEGAAVVRHDEGGSHTDRHGRCDQCRVACRTVRLSWAVQTVNQPVVPDTILLVPVRRCEQHVLMSGSDVFDIDHLAVTLLSALKSTGGDAGIQTALFEVLGSVEGAGMAGRCVSMAAGPGLEELLV